MTAQATRGPLPVSQARAELGPIWLCAFSDTPPYADGAAYDLNVGTWRAISDAPVGFRFTVRATVGDDVYALSQCDPGPTCPAGRTLLRYRSRADVWDSLPAPDGVGGYRLVAALAGVVAFSSSDTRTGAWLEIEPRPDTSDVYDEVIATAPNQGMVVFGGQTWASGDGQLVNDTWLWSPPALTR